MHREPDMGFDPGSPGSRPGPKAGARPLRHPGIPKLDFKPKTITRDEEGHYIIIKGTIQQEDLTIVNIYAHNQEAPIHTNQLITNLKKFIDNNTIIVRDFKTPLTAMDRSSKQKINRKQALKRHTGPDGLHRYIQIIPS